MMSFGIERAKEVMDAAGAKTYSLDSQEHRMLLWEQQGWELTEKHPWLINMVCVMT